jgi:hypothetical protein
MPGAGIKRRRAPEGDSKKAGGAKRAKGAGGKAGGAKGAGGGGGGKPAPRKGPPKQSYYEKVATSKPAKDADDDYDKADEPEAPAAKRRVAASGKPAAAPAKRAARDDDEDGGSVDDSAAAPTSGGGGGFAAAMAKVLGRSLSSGANPVLAKRHTAGQKIAAKRAADVKEVKLKAREKKAARRAHLAAPEAAPADYERQLRKVATKGGALLAVAVWCGVLRPSGRAWGATAMDPVYVRLTRCSPSSSTTLSCLSHSWLAVVSLFNTIAKHQKAVAAATATQDAKVKETRAAAEEERLRPSATSHSFLDLLHQNTAKPGSGAAAASAFEGGASSAAAAGAGGGKWAVLRDDYLSSGKAAKAGDGDGDDLPDILDSDDDE